ncbi:MAG: 30S ribosomal protein S16 [Gammaproteobacteria bacterium]
MVVIRLARAGAKKRPFYHIVVMNKSVARDGKFIERLGFYNPVARGQAETLRLNVERIDYWLAQGAQLSDTVRSLVKQARQNAEAA